MIAKHTFRQKRRFDTRFRETVITKAVLTQNETKRNLSQKKTSFWHDI